MSAAVCLLRSRSRSNIDNIGHPCDGVSMASLNVHMPVDLRDFVDQRTKKGGFSTPTEYVRHLIREDQQREAERRIEELFAEGVRSGRAKGSVEDLFKQLHKFMDERTEKKQVKRSNGKAARQNTRG